MRTSLNISTLEVHQASSFDGLAQTVTQRDGLQFTEFRRKNKVGWLVGSLFRLSIFQVNAIALQ